MYTSTVVGEGKCVLFREVSLLQGVLFREVPLYIKLHEPERGPCGLRTSSLITHQGSSHTLSELELQSHDTWPHPKALGTHLGTRSGEKGGEGKRRQKPSHYSNALRIPCQCRHATSVVSVLLPKDCKTVVTQGPRTEE